MAFQDKTLTCRDCGQEFVFTAGEQEYFQTRGLTNEPGRCPDCRRARRAGGHRSGDRSGARPDRPMFAAVCSSCGKDTEVPFQPRADRPVYCRECFDAVRSR
ncbi:MAG TPA: zinc-ribbon domain containing protein [Chloroflexota bacterium]|jgi:CxxC-x17-CxxC domain-containing protein|nr:zinc-ribbon domain containing protein [Chloroflexota bacterium]